MNVETQENKEKEVMTEIEIIEMIEEGKTIKDCGQQILSKNQYVLWYTLQCGEGGGVEVEM